MVQPVTPPRASQYAPERLRPREIARRSPPFVPRPGLGEIDQPRPELGLLPALRELGLDPVPGSGSRRPPAPPPAYDTPGCRPPGRTPATAGPPAGHLNPSAARRRSAGRRCERGTAGRGRQARSADPRSCRPSVTCTPHRGTGRPPAVSVPASYGGRGWGEGIMSLEWLTFVAAALAAVGTVAGPVIAYKTATKTIAANQAAADRSATSPCRSLHRPGHRTQSDRRIFRHRAAGLPAQHRRADAGADHCGAERHRRLGRGLEGRSRGLRA